MITDFWHRKARFTGTVSVFFTSDFETVSVLGNRIVLAKTRCILLFSFKRRFEWCMMIKGKYQNQGGDRFTREGSHYMEPLLLSKLWGYDFFVFCGTKVHDYTQFSMLNLNISNSES